ncbi:hypothetical protein LCGC14_1774940 [marine sediment metagenome]|uniref:Calcineurin-like phosphoesterase domain-containing protein n=1 Tax=marine sediment metagenome TaxID=412755 RepID=A0A0F9HJN1_9ZZZZ
MKIESTGTNYLVVISDLHCGCQFGLCPPGKIKLDGGGSYAFSEGQKKVWGYWQRFWHSFVPNIVGSHPYSIVLNGDAMDGRHHDATTLVSGNLSDQLTIAREAVYPEILRAKQGGGYFYYIRGTEAHGGKAGEIEERLACELGAIPSYQSAFSE